MRASLPLRVVTLGFQATSALVGASMQTAASAAGSLGTAATTGLNMAAIPVREGVRALSEGLPAPTLTRHSWRGEGRAWIEVRGLDGADGAELGRIVVDVVRARPGVKSASLNRPLSRVVVGLNGDHVSLRDLCRDVDEAEKRWRAGGTVGNRQGDKRPKPLPGDGLLLATNALGVGATAVGVSAAVAGRLLRWPRMFDGVEAMVVAVDYQPRLRRLLEDRLGPSATNAVLSVAMTTAHVLELSPASLAVDLAMESLKAAEYRAEAQAWRRHEPALARHAEHPEVHPASRPVPPPEGTVERHARRSALVQMVGTAAVGAATRNIGMASTMALVTTPKATRTTRESFAATLGQGLADQHGVLPLHPESLRWLDRVDALLVDPRVLCTDALRVVRVRGADEDELSPAWNRAQLLLENRGLTVGWHPVPGLTGRNSDTAVEALVGPTPHPLAAAVLAEARRSGLDLVSVDIDDLGELRPAFDDLRPLQRTSIDNTLAATLTDLQQSGRVVAVVSSSGAQALSSADVGLGVMPNSDADPPPWTADLILSNLGGVWRLLHAVPAARSASQRGIEISTGATALGALLMVPGVRGRGPGPVTTGAAAGLLSGFLMARRVLRAPEPLPAPIHEWHAMSVDQVRKMLPPPDDVETAEPHRRALTARAMDTAHRGAELTGRPRQAVWQFVRAVRAELSDPLTPVLALGSAASAVLGSPIDAVLVGSVLTGNSMLAASQRLRAESRLNELLAQQIPPARRVTIGPDGEPLYTDVKAAQLRPGDVIEVRTHEVVPADARLIEEDDLEVDESTLTGESLPVEKQVDQTPGADLAERRCMLYGGTTIVAGTAVAVVTAVGADTQARRAAELVSSELPAIGLEHQLSQLTNKAFPVSAGGGLLVGALGLLRQKGLRQAVSSGIAITVAAVPEGMPLVATLAQAASARRLTTYGALVRVPRSVEALGRIDVVCFDKTGTLSENRLRVSQVHPVAGYSREDVLRFAVHAAPDANGGPQVHATDRAIIEAGLSVNGSGPTEDADAHLPFRSGRSFSASVFEDELTVKGAPEVVLAACPDAGPDIEKTVRKLAAEGLRVIAVARRTLSPQQAALVAEDEDVVADLAGSELSLAGFLGLSDTPRPEAPGLIAALTEREIGIRLITGDHPITATAIARELGIPVTAEQVISGAEWDALSRKDQERVVTERVIFARMSPENKVQVVQTLERAGKVCAMVGDGANDAAAIRAATVGIGVVARGSDSSSVAADVVLLDERVEALLHAIDEGRELWRRVQSAVSVLLGGNAGEVAFAIIGSAITGTSPLNTRQLLLVNIFTDALPAAALAVSKPSGPARADGRGPDQDALWRAVAIRGATTAAAATGAWAMAGVTGRPARASTVALVALVSAQLGQTLLDSRTPLVVLTAGGSLAVMGTLISIPGVSQLLGCTPLGPLAWAQALGSAGAATAAVGVANRVFADKQPPELGSGDQTPDGAPRPPRRRRDRAAHTAASGERSTGQPELRLVGRRERPSSPYSRR